MSAVPHDARRSQPNRQAEPLSEALQIEASAHQRLGLRETRIRQAIDDSADQLVYRWQTADEREAEVRVYYHRHEDVDILAAQLLRIDYRQPTVQERARYEDEFEAEVLAGGDVWRDVASHVVG